MIREDRIQLNDRFRKVFKVLEERGEIVLNDRSGKGIGDFAEKILGNRAYGHIIRAFLNPDDKRVIDYRHARAVCREYGVNEGYLIDGIGTPFGEEAEKGNYPPVNLRRGNILFTTVQAFAGSGADIGAEVREDHEFFSVPGIGGSGLVAFPIEGESMEPLISDGDTVVCREIGGTYDIKDNAIYAVKNKGTVWIKHVQKISDPRGRVNKLRLISANHLEYQPFEEEVDENTRLYKLIHIIRPYLG